MKLIFTRFLAEEQGQDLPEYALLIVFGVFTIAVLGGCFQAGIGGITSVTNSNLISAAAVAH